MIQQRINFRFLAPKKDWPQIPPIANRGTLIQKLVINALNAKRLDVFDRVIKFAAAHEYDHDEIIYVVDYCSAFYAGRVVEEDTDEFRFLAHLCDFNVAAFVKGIHLEGNYMRIIMYAIIVGYTKPLEIALKHLVIENAFNASFKWMMILAPKIQNNMRKFKGEETQNPGYEYARDVMLCVKMLMDNFLFPIEPDEEIDEAFRKASKRAARCNNDNKPAYNYGTLIGAYRYNVRISRAMCASALE